MFFYLQQAMLIKRQEFAHAYQSLSNVQKIFTLVNKIETYQTKHWESPTKAWKKDIDPYWYSLFRTQTTSKLDRQILKTFKNIRID